MPMMDGSECYARLKEIDPDVRVVFCTGHARGEVARRLLAEGTPAVVTKPCSLEELEAALAEAIRARRQMPQPE